MKNRSFKQNYYFVYSLNSIFCNLIFSIFVAFFCAACSDDNIVEPPDRLGTVMFTATHDCLIVLLDPLQNPITSQYYELGKQPLVVYMKAEGMYYLHAYSFIPNGKPFTDSLKYERGNVEYYIEF